MFPTAAITGFSNSRCKGIQVGGRLLLKRAHLSRLSDAAANRLDKFDPHGRLIRQWGACGTADGQFYMPSGIVQDVKGRILIVDLGNDRVQMFSPDGEFIRMFAVSEAPHTTAHTHGWQAQLMQARNDQSVSTARIGSPPAAGMSFLSNAGTYQVKYLAVPTPIPLNQPFDLQFSLREQNGKTLGPGTTVQVDAGMPAHHHGMNLKPTVKLKLTRIKFDGPPAQTTGSNRS